MNDGNAERPKLREDVLRRRLDDELVLYDPLHDGITLLNESAAVVLGLCDGERPVRRIVDEVHGRFGGDRERVEGAVANVLAKLREGGLLCQAGSSPGQGPG